MTLTTEQLEERAKLFREKATAENTSSRQSVAMLYAEVFEELIEARELLANREAQPAGFYTTVSGRKGVVWHNGAPEDDTAIYTAPPAPAVPEIDELRLKFERAERESDDGFILHKYGIGYADEATQARWESWLACRAAMLAQPVSGGYKLPPHLYRELVNSLRDTAVKFSGTEQLRERLNTALSQFIEPDHPHTRSVAPEGGNDHDTRR